MTSESNSDREHHQICKHVSTEKGFKLWDVGNDQEILIPGLAGRGIKEIGLSPDAQFLLAFDVDGPVSGSTRVFRLEDRTETAISKELRRSTQVPPHVFFSPKGRFFLEVGFGGTRLVDLKTGRVVRLYDSLNIAPDVAFSADDSYLGIATQDQGAFIYRTDDLKRGPIAQLQPKGTINGLAISRDNRYDATANWGKSYPAGVCATSLAHTTRRFNQRSHRTTFNYPEVRSLILTPWRQCVSWGLKPNL